MHRFKQFLLITYALFVSIITILLLVHLYLGFSAFALLVTMPFYLHKVIFKIGITIILVFILSISAYLVYYALTNGRMSKKIVQRTEIGSINIDVYAIEAIALNAAKTAQAGIKTAKAKARADKKGAINIILDCVLYSEVDIPMQMHKIQERVKKDIERYTGISVNDVLVKVNRVEVVGTRVEK